MPTCVALGLGDPDAMPDVVRVVNIDCGRTRGDRRENRSTRPRRVFVQADNRRRVDAGRPEQAISVLARGLERALVRKHAGPRTKRLQPQSAEEAALCPLSVRTRDAVRLLVDVDRRTRVLVEGPVGAPGSQRPRRAPVAIVRLVAGFDAGHVEANDVLRVAGEKARGLLRADDVIRRGHDGGQVANRLGVVAQGTERADLGHGLPQASAIAGGHGADQG